MKGQWRPRPLREASVGVQIIGSTNFTVGDSAIGTGDGDRGREPPEPPAKPPTHHRLRTYTGRVLEGHLILPDKPMGDLVLGIAFVQRGEETSIVTATLDNKTVNFAKEDFETVNGARATVSYLTSSEEVFPGRESGRQLKRSNT